MPEGDTLHRTANRLRPALVGGVLERFEARACWATARWSGPPSLRSTPSASTC
ncbi:MAG: hypothetical protein R2711_07315 [Acidimicrobiales bacterium]